MKKIIFAIISFLLIGVSSSVSAQSSAAKHQARIERSKELKKQLNEKASKDARKEAKRLAKEGYTPAPGGLPLEKQLDRAWMFQNDIDDDGENLYIWGDANSIGGNYDAAKAQAFSLAKIQIAGKIEAKVGAMIDDEINNNQLNSGEVVSNAKTTQVSTSLINQSLKKVITLMEYYRKTKDGKYEVCLTIAVKSTTAEEISKRIMDEELKHKNDSLRKKLDEKLDW